MALGRIASNRKQFIDTTRTFSWLSQTCSSVAAVMFWHHLCHPGDRDDSAVDFLERIFIRNGAVTARSDYCCERRRVSHGSTSPGNQTMVNPVSVLAGMAGMNRAMDSNNRIFCERGHRMRRIAFLLADVATVAGV